MVGGGKREIAVLSGARCMGVLVGGGPEKVKTNTNGGAQRYTSNQRQTLMKVSGNVSDIPAPQANK